MEIDFTQQMIEDAKECVDHYSQRFGNRLDYSVESLELIDEILEEAADFYEDMTEERQNWIVFRIGTYILEVARTNFGGAYFWYAKLEQPVLVTGQPDYEVSILAFEKVKGRMVNGGEDNIPFFFRGYTEKLKTVQSGETVLFV